MSNVAVLWDVENVTPDADSLFVEGFFEYVNTIGNISLANAFGNWTNPTIAKLANPLASKHFELIHIPKSRKNSSDINMITKGIEIAFQYPQINKFVLVTGDVDFRPLVIALRKQSKQIHIVCDVKTASEDLLSLANSFKDFRELIPSEYEIDEEIELETPSEKKIKRDYSNLRQKAYEKLVEAINKMISENVKPGMGLVKIRMLMLNPSFDEKDLGFKSWSEFIGSAVDKGYIQFQGKEILELSSQVHDIPLKSEFDVLLTVLTELGLKEPEKYHYFPEVHKILLDKHKFSYKSLGYKKFQDFIQAATRRDLVETRVNGLSHFVRKK
jgi:hypothetical protein